MNATETQELYSRRTVEKGDDRDDLLRNRGLLFQYLANQRSICEALRPVAGLRSGRNAPVLDVGCGDGTSLLHLLELGFSAQMMHGIDIRPSVIERGRRRLPACTLSVADACNIPYPDATFDLVIESTMFVLVTEASIRANIAREMARVTKPGGFLLIVDWRYGGRGYQAVTRRCLRSLYPGCDIVRSVGGALIPPVGRTVSKWCPSLYFLIHRWCPPLIGLKATLLCKSLAEPTMAKPNVG
jgi:ubiquinone/menaquinone biosynthesis C-methylase UbiE